MKAWIITLAVLACSVSGCASHRPAGSAASGATLQAMLARAPDMKDDEAISYLAGTAMDKLEEVCGAQRNVISQTACLREALLSGFDNTGEAAKHCDRNAPIDKTLRCVMTGAIGYELALHENLATAASYNWDDPRGSLRTTARQLRSKVQEDCAAKSLTDGDACILSRTGEVFSLPDSQVVVCAEPKDLDRSIDCLLRSFLIHRIGGAVENMSVEKGEAI